MRIIGGLYKGKQIKWTQETTTRPTKDCVRESLFNLLENSLHLSLKGARALDLFAGTGSLVFEALSRGAASGTFVEMNPKVRSVLWENIFSLNLQSCCQVLGLKAQTILKRGNSGPSYDFIFLDPPYKLTSLADFFETLTSQEWLSSTGHIIIETHKDTHYHLPNLECCVERVYGIVKILIFRRIP